MKRSPGLFGQLNDRIVSGAGVVNLQIRNVEIGLCTYVPSSLRCPCSLQLGNDIVGLLLTYRPLKAPSDRSE